MDIPHDDAEGYVDGSPLPPSANHWVPLFLPLLAATMGLMFVGIMLLTLH
jgi:hypothetical protein